MDDTAYAFELLDKKLLTVTQIAAAKEQLAQERAAGRTITFKDFVKERGLLPNPKNTARRMFEALAAAEKKDEPPETTLYLYCGTQKS